MGFMCGFPMEFLTDSYVERTAKGLVGRLPGFLAVGNIMINSSLERYQQFLGGCPFIGNEIINKSGKNTL
jgi:hypothetical protein